MSEKPERTYLIDNKNLAGVISEGFLGNIPHSQALGIETVSAERNKATLKLPYKDELVGNLSTGVIHGGVMISLMDSVGGMTTFCALPAMEAIATLDLRVDYLKPAVAGLDIFATGECYKLTNTIVFVRAVAYQTDISDPVASCVATFMRASSSKIQGVTK